MTGIAAVVLALVIAWALFVPVADWLTHHDVGSATGALHETALDNARGRLLTLGAGLFAAGALIFTARNFTVSRRTLELTEQGQVTDRYTKAIEQLGSDKLDVRIGGIYALERVARDSARDHPTIMEVLTAFIREHSYEQWPPLEASHEVVARPPRLRRRVRDRLGDQGSVLTMRLPGIARIMQRLSAGTQSAISAPSHDGRSRAPSPRPDVQAALTAVGRRDARLDIRPIDLAVANLTGAVLARADLAGADLAGADLGRADLTGADLGRADLANTDLTGATLAGANLLGANLIAVTLNGADLTGAWWPADVPVPEGWKLDVGSGRLQASGH